MTQHQARQIAFLREKILHIGGTVEAAFDRAITALLNRDASAAATVIAEDEVIDQMEIELEEECLKTLALYQPVASDLRLVVAILKINNDLERIGDLARNIAKRAVFLAQFPPCEFAGEVRVMAGKAQMMFKHSLDSLVEADAKLASQVRADDDEIDALNKRIHGLVRENLRAPNTEVEYWLKWNSVAKHIERVADMATHIAEDVIYLVEGRIVRHRGED
jgi:phosphate transport system protein